MTNAARKLLEEALSLSPAERRQLGEALIESADTDTELPEDWKREVIRRIEAIRNGASSLVPGGDVEAHVRAVVRGVSR